ncbi:MAG: glycerol-3-phosphate 1-O-acyltransferase PlsY [Candidatus Eisenbacteria bacterium]|nr:glycerol-3-phosphate 1-O-acyltransferase PlsY [Candidatus Eisenbacteria bacterium]
MAVTSAVAIGYGCGALPFGLWLGRILRGVDVRTRGSGNLGATNVYRSLGRGIGVATLVLDVAKGALPVAGLPRGPLGAAFPGGPEWCAITVGLAAVAGHVWTVFAGFRGGKGVATAGGVVIALAPAAALICLAVFVVTVWISRYISLGSILAAAAFPPVLAALSPRGIHQPTFALGVLMAALLILRHRENITRLRRGEERRFSLRGGASR